MVINQVRGSECCGAGGLNELKTQLQTAQKLDIKETFALRYDVLNDPAFLAELRTAKKNGQEMGALLEITPALAKAAGVNYNGKPESWYEAQTVFLLGYDPDVRLKLIDTYMRSFKQVFGEYPKTTVAWMIDPVSLQYLSSTYGVKIHELTREQWGTDSYTLYGGPPHYAYLPSANWALVPSAVASASAPLIVRQTITDPVWTYGDPTSSYTSQPNDYRHRHANFDYFKFLFYQSQDQPTETYTMSVLGLENSMGAEDQAEFNKQLQFVAEWAAGNGQRAIMPATDFATWWHQEKRANVTVYQGKTQNKDNSRAWWITTPQYRLRLRADDGKLYLTDLRLYSPAETDPYLNVRAKRFGYWVVPFLIDGSRFLDGDKSYDFLTSLPDNLADRAAKNLTPTRLTLMTGLTAYDVASFKLERDGETVYLTLGGKKIIVCNPENFSLVPDTHAALGSVYLKDVISFQNQPLQWNWTTRDGKIAWGCGTGSDTTCNPSIDVTVLDSEREQHYPLMFPELQVRSLSKANSYVYVNNRYALAGRNPIRLVFYPRDGYGYPVSLAANPDIKVDPGNTHVSLEAQHGGNGMIFIDLVQSQPTKVAVNLTQGEFSFTTSVYFAPDCRHELGVCLKEPQFLYWYVRNFVADKWRIWQEKQASMVH